MPKKPEMSIGLEDGTMAPNTKVKTADCTVTPLLEMAGEKGLVVAFVRSLGWCPFCKKQIRLLDEVEDQIAAEGWQVVSLTYDAPDVLQAFRAKTGVSIPLLSDEGSAAIDAFGLRNHGVKPGGKSVGVPHPAVVLIGKDGTILKTLRHSGYQTRPSAEEVVDAIKSL